jgi:putative phosphoribosyl transferase
MASGERTLRIPARPSGFISGDLNLPKDAIGVVVFAHGSGSSRRSPRNRWVAELLQRRGLGTLLFDLLTDAEDAADRRTAQFRFDIALLAQRLGVAVAFLDHDPTTAQLPLGLFGASTGAAATLVAAAQRPERIAAVVSRGGRPDLAGAALAAVRAPTLFIVGGRDQVVLRLNDDAARQLRCPHELVIVPGATHLFQEPRALDEVARLAGEWFATHLSSTCAWNQ